MCTVTFIPARQRIYLTSNRDEKNWRTDALPPAVYPAGSGQMMYPKDGDAGGTWIAAHDNGNAIVFLNGGMEAHNPQPPYRKSRGPCRERVEASEHIAAQALPPKKAFVEI